MKEFAHFFRKSVRRLPLFSASTL